MGDTAAAAAYRQDNSASGDTSCCLAAWTATLGGRAWKLLTLTCSVPPASPASLSRKDKRISRWSPTFCKNVTSVLYSIYYNLHNNKGSTKKTITGVVNIVKMVTLIRDQNLEVFKTDRSAYVFLGPGSSTLIKIL